MSLREREALALLDAHHRVIREEKRILDRYEGHNERGAVLDSFEEASRMIQQTIIDRCIVDEEGENFRKRVDEIIERDKQILDGLADEKDDPDAYCERKI